MAKKKPITELMQTKAGKYFKAVKEGKTKTEAQIVAGYTSYNNSNQIENTKNFQEIQRYYKDTLLEKTTVSELADEHLKIIRQDIDLSSKLRAIGLAVEKIEPEDKGDEEQDQVIVILKD